MSVIICYVNNTTMILALALVYWSAHA